MAADKNSLRERLKTKRVPVDQINRFMAYVQGEKDKERNKDKKPVTNNDDLALYTMFMKFWAIGLVIDGVNVVITGRSMAMVTFHGYKNKVLQSYPTAKFDVQLVREGDEFTVSKKNGDVEYEHKISDPFSQGEIKGAYCIIKIDGIAYFEALNQQDFGSMQKASKQSYLWNTWASEFWLKSVIKRACKRHFYNEVEELEEQDNKDYGLSDKDRAKKSLASDELKQAIIDTKRGENGSST